MKDPATGGDSRGLAILIGLGKLGKHVYAGTVPQVEVQRRRTKSKAARAARRTNRRSGR